MILLGVIGDFNVIASVEEKIGGIPYQMSKSMDFLCMIEDYGLVDLGLYGPRCTWSNGRGQCSIVWKRLDRGLANDQWLAAFPATTVSNLASTGSDHTPLLLEIRVRQENGTKYFKFLNLWVDNANFKPFVKEIWDTKAKEYEEKLKAAEIVWAETNDEIDRFNLHDIKAQYIRYMKLEENFLKQKTHLQWFKEGDANSKYFHSLIRGRSRKLYIHKIKDEDGQWIYGDEAIGNAACDFYHNLFTDPRGSIREDLLSCIPSMITQEDNDFLAADPTLSELKDVVFSMNPTNINLLLRANFPEVKWPLNWQSLYPFIENLKHQNLITLVVWNKPSNGFVKVNSDGSALTNPGRIGAGVIIRDHNSEFIHAIAAPLGEGTNNLAETEAALLGIQWCLAIGFLKVHLESDSALLIQWLTNGKGFPWSLKMKLQHLLDLCNVCENFSCTHTYREANCPADSLSKISHDLTTLTEYHNIHAMPPHIRGQVLQDQLSTPAFRHKRTRRIMVPPHHASPSNSHGYG
ncbi:hypothetical protein A4A49_54977 [Nicotiana attenuata]|uniref:RNase H type-1 domain-containing protein n=1 Tax=Nicotiana attenuata TaxID=49451 RepID=A0A314KX10_NICAT|nr:hypothetical protein A4A49_54977 [Nicotiana attenuata]